MHNTRIIIQNESELQAFTELYARLERDRDIASRNRHHVIVDVINEQRAAIVQAFRDYADANK